MDGDSTSPPHLIINTKQNTMEKTKKKPTRNKILLKHLCEHAIKEDIDIDLILDAWNKDSKKAIKDYKNYLLLKSRMLKKKIEDNIAFDLMLRGDAPEKDKPRKNLYEIRMGCCGGIFYSEKEYLDRCPHCEGDEEE